jgi:hypothetical protein
LLGRFALPALKLALATLLAVSGFVHVGNGLLFLSAVVGYDIGGPKAAITAAALLPFLQIVLAAALIAHLRGRECEALVWTAALFALYSIGPDAEAVQRSRQESAHVLGWLAHAPSGPCYSTTIVLQAAPHYSRRPAGRK